MAGAPHRREVTGESDAMDEASNAATQPAPTRAKDSPNSAIARVAGWITAAAVVAAVGVAAGAAVVLLHERADAIAGPDATPPLPVAVRRIALVDAYEVEESFAGRIEAARDVALAFERGGVVVEVRVDEGAEIDEGDVIARLDARRLEAERARLSAEKRRLEAELALAERTRRRQENLSEKGFSSDQAFDEARTSEATTQAQISALDAQIVSLTLDIEKSDVKAPFVGRVAARAVDPGAVVAAGAMVAEVYETNALRARIGLPPERAAAAQLGDRAAIEVGDAALTGRLIALRPDLAPGTRTVPALYVIEGGAPVIGEIARATLTREVSARGVWLPLSALQESVGGLWSVYTVVQASEETSADGAVPQWRVEQEAVTPLRVRGGEAFVAGTIETGDLVVASGLNRIARGQTIRPLIEDASE